MIKSLKYVSGHELAGVQTLIDKQLRTGELPFELLKFFANATPKEREKMLWNVDWKVPKFLDHLTLQGKNLQELIKEIEETHDITKERDMMQGKKFTFSKEGRVKVALVSPRMLGFHWGNLPSFSSWLYFLKDSHQYDILPSIAGPQAYLQYPKLDIPELRVYIAMETIPGYGGDPCVFCVGHDRSGAKWINGRWFNPNRQLGLDDLWLVKSLFIQ